MAADIAAQHISLSDVRGDVLPPVPNQQESDATLAGIDKNNNGIRDDVELAIFKKYPKDLRVRAAELQYARALQNELTNVFDSHTLVAAIQQESRAIGCVSKTAPKISLHSTSMEIRKSFDIADERQGEVSSLVFNTTLRKEKIKQNSRYNTTYFLPNGVDCDLDPSMVSK